MASRTRSLAVIAALLIGPLAARADIPVDYAVVDPAGVGHRAVGDIDGDRRADIVALQFDGPDTIV